MDEKKNEYAELDLIELLQALWHRAWAIVLAAVIFAGAAFAYARYIITPLYEASALMYVNNSSFSLGSTNFSINNSELSAAHNLVNTYIIILGTRSTLEDVIEKAELDYSYEKLSKMITASAVNNTEIFRIKVTSPDPYEAQYIANVIARVLPGKISDVVDGSSVRIVDYAVAPKVKSSPNVSKYTMVGLLLGIAVSCAVIILARLFDDQIHDDETLSKSFNIPLLASIPDLKATKSGRYGYYKNYRRYGYYYNNSSGSSGGSRKSTEVKR